MSRLARSSWTVALAVVAGCTQPAMRLQSPEQFESLISKVRLIGDATVAFGMHPMRIQAVGMVANLAGGGSNPGPGPARSELLGDMQRRDVLRPNDILASEDTALVHVYGMLQPGLQRGDHFDIFVTVPPRSDTANLTGGRLFEARLREKVVLGNRVREGKVWALAKGAVLIDPLADDKGSPESLLRGRVLGGAVALKPRPLGLVIKPEFRSLRTSQQIGDAIDRRFHVRARSLKKGVATPKNDEYIDIIVHPRYKDNLLRYMQVLQSIPIAASVVQQQARLRLLKRQLLDPITAATAAIRLEAIGKDALEVLKNGISSSDPEVRFYAAEALAYLDDPAAAAPLAAAARHEPAFRAHALTALSAMDDPAARDELIGLMNGTSAETRYGAFRALWAMNPRDPFVRGEDFDGRFSFHVVAADGPPMIHVTRTFRPEIVVFGSPQVFRAPLILDAGKQILVNGSDAERVVVSRFAPGEADKKRVVSNRVDEVIRAIAELGGSYPDVVQALAQAKASGSLLCRFEIDAIPSRGRAYTRGLRYGGEPGVPVESPVGNLYPETAASEHDPRTPSG